MSSIIQLPTDTVIPHSKGSWDLTDFVLKITLKRHFVVLETKFETENFNDYNINEVKVRNLLQN